MAFGRLNCFLLSFSIWVNDSRFLSYSEVVETFQFATEVSLTNVVGCSNNADNDVNIAELLYYLAGVSDLPD